MRKQTLDLLVAVFAIGLICYPIVRSAETGLATLKIGKELNLISINNNEALLQKLPSNSQETALVIQAFDSDKAFGEFELQFGELKETQSYDAEIKETINNTFSPTSSNCKITKPGQKCFVNLKQSNISGINFICKEQACNSNFKVYLISEQVVADQSAKLLYEEDILLVKYSISKVDPLRTVIESRLKNSLDSKANDTTIQIFGIESQSEISGDTLLTYISIPDKFSAPIYIIYSGKPKAEIEVRIKTYTISDALNPEKTYVDYFSKSNYLANQSYQIQFTNNQGYDYIKFIFKWYGVIQGEVYLTAQCTDYTSLGQSSVWYQAFTPSIEYDKLDEDIKTGKQYSLIISKSTAQKMFKNSQTVYFGVNTQNSGFFKFQIQVQNGDYPEITMNEIVGGTMKQDVINLLLQIPKSKLEKISVDLKNVSYGAVDMYLRECQSSKCISEKYTADNVNEMNSYSAHRELDYTTKSIEFLPNCATNEHELCSYIIGLVSSDSTSLSQYKVEVFARETDKRVNVLTENVLFENLITQNDYQYYVIYLENTSNIQFISVKTSSSHVQLYVSVDNRCMNPSPKCENSELLKKGLNTKPVYLTKNETQRGVVYVGIYGYSATSYTLVVEVQRANSTQVTQLVSGSLYHGQLSPHSLIQYFVFDPSTSIDEKKKDQYDFESIEINIRGQKDKIVIMASNDGSMPYDGDNGFMWSSTNGFLFISKSDPKFVKNAVYKIAIMATEHAFDISPSHDNVIQSSNSLQFQLLLSTSAHTKIIELGQTLQDQIQIKGEKLYQIHLKNEDETFIISNHSKDYTDKQLNLVMVIGSAPYDKEEEYEIKYSFSQSYYEITPIILKEKLCKEKPSCDVFIGIVNKMNENISFSVIVWNRKYAIELDEGIQHSDGLIHIDEYTNLYYYPSNKDHSLNIYVSSIYGHTSFNVILWKNSQQLPSLQWPFPSSTKVEDLNKYHYNSGIHNSHSITFQAQAFEQCWPDCILLISLSSYQGLPADGEDQENFIQVIKNDTDRYNDKFTILVSTIYSDLLYNQQLEFTLESQDAKFFYLSLDKILKSKEYLLIEMTNLSGKAVIGVMIKDDINNRYPNTLKGKEADLVSYSNYLKITSKQLNSLMKKHQLKVENNPQLIVEVTCISESAGKFVLVAQQGNSTAIDLMHGLPQEVHLLPYQLRYYKYFHFSDSDFSIKFSREMGYADLSLRVCKDQKTSSFESFQKCLKTSEVIKEQHAAGEAGSTIHVTRNNKELYCQNCLYIIGVQGEEAEAHAFLNILLQQDFTWLQEGRQIIDSVDKSGINLYRISVDSDEETYITLQQYTGDVQLFYSYRYSYLMQDYIGPIAVNPTDKFIHLTLRPRQDVSEDDSFNTSNKPNQIKVPSFNKNTESKKNSEEKNSITENATFDDLSDYFYEAEIFLSVMNNKKDISANYSLVFNAGDEYRYIYDGQIMGSSIPPQKKITYLYHHFEYEAPARLNIFSHSKLFSMESNLKILGFHDLQKNRRDYKDVTRDPISLELISGHQSSLSYKLPERNGTYELVFMNDHMTKTLNISLSINSRDILLIPLTHKIEHALSATSKNYYEVIAPKKGYITLQITHCTGSFSVGVSQDYTSFLKEDYTSYFNSFPGSSHVQTFIVNPGPVFFAISTELEESLYKIRPDFFTSMKSIPHDKIEPGNQGVVYHKRKMGGQTEISFAPISCDNCSSALLKSGRVQYDVIYSTDLEILNVLGKCSAQNYFEHDAKNQLHFKTNVDPKEFHGQNYKQKSFSLNMNQIENIKFTINLEDDENIFFVSVVAQVTNIPGGLFRELTVFYENSQIDKIQVFVQGEASVYAFLFACILIMIFFCMTTCLFWRRYKSMQQGLEVSHKWRDIEMKQEKRKQFSANKHLNNDELNTTEINTSRDRNLDDSFAGKPFENPDLYEPSDNNLASHLKSNQEANNQKEENPFDKISIKIKPPPSNVKATKQGYDQFIDE